MKKKYLKPCTDMVEVAAAEMLCTSTVMFSADGRSGSIAIFDEDMDDEAEGL